MTDKTIRPAFQPAPRPRPLNDAGSTEALRKATEDLGFNRPTSAPAAGTQAAVTGALGAEPIGVAEAPAAAPEPKGAASAPAPRVVPKAKPAKPAPVIAFAERETSLKFVIDDELSTALKLDAVKRRVTVRYLVLEALAEKGYPVDLANLPEDGRRIRK